MKTNKIKEITIKLGCFLCALSVLLAALIPNVPKAEASSWTNRWEQVRRSGRSTSGSKPKTLKMEQAVSYALATSVKYKQKYNKQILDQMKYDAAVQSVKAKWKDYRTFRYSPLLGLKFPTWPYMDEEFDLALKPFMAQMQIETTKREIKDMSFELQAKAEQVFIDVYAKTERLSFTEKTMQAKKEALVRNKAKLAQGLAKADDVTKTTDDIKKTENDIAKQRRELEADKKKLGELTGLDLSSGWVFANPMGTASIPREKLEDIVQYTLNMDMAVFGAKQEAGIKMKNLQTYQNLMQNFYGWTMNYINADIESGKLGRDVDYAAFKSRYDSMLDAIQRPWNGNIWIPIFLFIWIPIPKEYFKGKLSATRYIDNDRYALYTSVSEYVNAKADMELTMKDCRSSVESTYETVVTSYNTYKTMQEITEKMRGQYEKVLALNKLGKAEFVEVSDALISYQEAQMDELEFLGEHNRTISEFNRMTCGAVKKYINNEPFDNDAGKEGESFNVLTDLELPYYVIDQPLEETTFSFTLYVPAEYEPRITEYELWYEDQQIGGRMKVGKEIVHLYITYQDTLELKVRAYEDGEFVGEASIDATIPRDTVTFPKAEKPVKVTNPTVVGTYIFTPNPVMGISNVSFRMEPSEKADGFVITTQDGRALYSETPQPVDKGFVHLGFAISELAALRIQFFNGSSLEYTAEFDTANKQIIIPAEEE